MYRNHSVGVVVPAYNEEGLVGDVIDTIPSFVDRVYVVDDRSTDSTWSEIQRHAELANRTWSVDQPLADGGVAFDRRVVPFRHETNRGVGAAIKTGYCAARDDELDVVAVMNGDGQMDPAILDRIIEPVVEGRADYVKGNRLVYPDYREGMSGWRFFGNSVLSMLTKVSSGYWKLTDPQNGYTAISGRALDVLDVDALYDDYGFCNHLLVRLNAHGMCVADVAMPAVYGDERSSIRYSRFIPSLSWLLLRSFVWRLKTKHVRFDFHPLVCFYLLGVVASLVGSLGVGYAGYVSLGGSDRAAIHGWFGFLVTLVGCLSLSVGMLLDMRQSVGLERLEYDRIDEFESGGRRGPAVPKRDGPE